MHAVSTLLALISDILNAQRIGKTPSAASCLIRAKNIPVGTTLLCRGDPFICTESDGFMRMPKRCKDKKGLLRLANQPYYEKGAQFMCGYCNNNYQICPLEKDQIPSVEDYFTTITSITATTHDFNPRLP
uniref:Uncharacterized protein n=1 Tax=Parascaris equorum TaxID=6256 RepID=A0A914RRM8_PAREQ